MSGTDQLPATVNGAVPVVATTAIPEGPALSAETLESVMVGGDLAKLSARQRVEWYRARCDAAGLDPRAQPFQYLSLNGKLVLYATKNATEQLTGIHRLTLEITGRERDEASETYLVHARATFPDGHFGEDCGAVCLQGLKGEALANAIMKATTKAKRRTILSACGLGMIDESEIDSIEGARPIGVVDAHSRDRLPLDGPPPKNNSGHGRGQYASPQQIAEYKAKVESYLQTVNAEWLDHWTDQGEVPKGIKEIPIWQADGHLLKWSVETGRLDGGIVPEEAKTRQLAAYTAIVYHRSDEDRRALALELKRYVAEQHGRQREFVYRNHPELRPAEEAAAEAEDEQGGEWFDPEDLDSTEAGSRG